MVDQRILPLDSGIGHTANLLTVEPLPFLVVESFHDRDDIYWV